MNSSIDICNIALQLLGSRKITSFNDETVEARLCNAHYHLSRAFLLRRHPWNFAIKRVLLAPLAVKPVFGWKYQFEKPGDYILLLEVDDLTVAQYAFEGNKILADTNVLNVRYVSDIDDPSLFDSGFVSTLAHHLAIELFDSLDGTIFKKNELLSRFNDLLDEAQMADGKENPITPIYESSWLLARI